MTLKKQLLAGFLAGAVLITGGIISVNASPRDDVEIQQRAHQSQMNPDFSKENVAKRLSERFGVSESEVLAAFENKVHPRDIDHAALLSKLTGKSFSEILSMHSTWRDVEKKLGVTEDQMREIQMQVYIESIAEDSYTNAETVKSLIDDGYNPHDIMIAGYIANQSGNSIRYVLSRRKINNHWSDVAKEFGVNAPARNRDFPPEFADDLDDDDDDDIYELHEVED